VLRTRRDDGNTTPGNAVTIFLQPLANPRLISARTASDGCIFSKLICGGICMRSLSERFSDWVEGYFEAESFDNSPNASCTVVMNCAGKMIVEFLSTEISAIVCRVRS
jgi:hypothetical protein